MLSVDLYNQKGDKVGKVELSEGVFGVELNPNLIHQAYVTQKANSRVAIAHTKTRGEVRGGGAKPWRQKGTGRARHGSNRSPIWIGGGVTFGPRNDRNFSKKINKKQKQKALFMALTSKLNDNELAVVDSLSFNEIKTKNAVEFVNNISEKVLKRNGGRVLVVLPNKDVEVELSFRNIPRVKTIHADSLNVVDLLEYKYIVMIKDSVDVIEKTFTKLKK